MIEVRKTRVFVEWLRSLRDLKAQTRIRARVDRLEYGLFGDAKYFDGIGNCASITARDTGSISLAAATR